MIINQDFGINKKVTSGVGLEIRVGIEVRLELALGVESRGWVLGLGRVTRSVFRFVSQGRGQGQISKYQSRSRSVLRLWVINFGSGLKVRFRESLDLKVGSQGLESGPGLELEDQGRFSNLNLGLALGMILRSGTCSRSNPRSGFVRLRIGFFIVLGHVSKFGVIVFAYIIPQISLNKILHTNRIHTHKKKPLIFEKFTNGI